MNMKKIQLFTHQFELITAKLIYTLDAKTNPWIPPPMPKLPSLCPLVLST